MQTGRSAKTISIIALVFAPIGLLISLAIYTRDTPLDRTPLLIGAGVLALLEMVAACTTLLKNPIGSKLFTAYGIAALALVLADGAYLFAMPARDHGPGLANDAIGTAGDALGLVFHLSWCIGAFAWPIVVLVLSRPKPASPGVLVAAGEPV